MGEKLLEKVFSVKRDNNRKIIRLLGTKMSFRLPQNIREELERSMVKVEQTRVKDKQEILDKLEYKYQQIVWWIETLHRHMDISFQDVLRTQNFVREHSIVLETDYPVAINSDDHKYPFGTKNDDTRCPRFIRKCEGLFSPDRDIKFLDLGCSGGGLVLDACLRNHIGIGLEGSDYSYLNQRAEWRVIPNNLFTCDITKDFTLYDKDTKDVVKFEIVSAWELLEHIEEYDLPVLFANISKHLCDDGYFIGSVSTVDSIYPGTDINLHKTVKPRDWWQEKIREFGFEEVDAGFVLEDFARGSGNSCVSWGEHMGEYERTEVESSFHLVLRKIR